MVLQSMRRNREGVILQLQMGILFEMVVGFVEIFVLFFIIVTFFSKDALRRSNSQVKIT